MTEASITTHNTTQQWLDSHQYSPGSIALYECVFGKDFVSPGGRQLSAELTKKLQLTAGQHVLDVGCGLGGSAFLMARQYAANVLGIDLSKNMITLANERLDAYQLSDKVQLEQKDCLRLNQTSTFDALYSRDVFLHIADKPRLFKVLHRALKGDGRLLFTDYACGPQPWHPEFSRYVVSRNYSLHTLEHYTELIEKSGFHSVQVEDHTPRFIDQLHQDLTTINTLTLPQTDRQALAASWSSKIQRAEGGDHRWVIATARAAK